MTTHTHRPKHRWPISPLRRNEKSSRGFHDLTGLVRWLTIALASLAFIELVQIVSLWLEIGLLTQAQSGGGITREAALANDRREDLLSIISLLAYLLTAVLFLRWTYLVKKNAMALGASFLEFEFSPGWSVGYYFVPFVNLVAPYKALKETFQASHPEFRPDSQRLEWSSAPKLLPFWWALWLVNGFLGQGIFQYSLHAKTLPQLLNMSWAHFAGAVLDLPLIAVVWVLVSTMQRWQNRPSFQRCGGGRLAGGSGRDPEGRSTTSSPRFGHLRGIVFLDLDPVVFGLGLRLDGHGAVRYTSRGALIGAALVAVDCRASGVCRIWVGGRGYGGRLADSSRGPER